uniref:C2 domain-containing protein n=1 Tax=Strigamia maritima TaxID=126957 RepID=T1JBU8_STRMM
MAQIWAVPLDKTRRIQADSSSIYSKVIENSDETALFEEAFEWPVARAIERHEILQIQILNYNKYFNNRVIGNYGLVLQHVVDDGLLKLTDTLLDANNMPIGILLSMEIKYCCPESSSSSLASANPDYHYFDDDQQTLLDIEQNIANLERSLAVKETNPKRNKASRSISLASARSLERKRGLSVKTLTSMMRLGKQRPPAEEFDKISVKSSDSVPEFDRHLLDGVMKIRRSTSSEDGSLATSDDDECLDHSYTSSRRARLESCLAISALKAQDFQVCITVIEARQLAGLNMDPVVCVQLGSSKKYTGVKESTNCPYYNEYFVFDFHMAPAMLFDKIITLTVYHSRKFLRAGTVVGSFKLDVKTVYDAPDHQFYHKWAVLTDPDDVMAGPRGYLKCDISVIGRGDSVKIPPKSEKDDDDIEANLLLPAGIPAERQRARIIVRVYRADGLPRMNAGIMANVKKAFTGEAKDLVDPFVQVSFAGMSVMWNEQVVFTEMFPPLCQRIKIQLRDNDSVNDPVIGTHFIELSKISNDGDKGFLPTFGPAFVYLYGSTRHYSIFDQHTALNDGLGEGVSYRGRILIAVRTEMLDILDVGTSNVEVESTLPIVEQSYGRYEEFFLFGAITDASMIDQRLGTRPVVFELSIGNAGNILDGSTELCKLENEGELDDESGLESIRIEGPKWHSGTPSIKPHSTDRYYYYLPYLDRKPCMYVRTVFQDHRRRMYNSNIISKITDKLDEALSDVVDLMEQENPQAEKRLKMVLEELSNGCNRFTTILSGVGGGAASGKTKLDKERIRMCQKEIDHINNVAKSIKLIITKANLKEKLKATQNMALRLRDLIDDPQDALPDVFLWMIMSGKRNQGPSGWAIQAKVSIYLWLGLTKHKKNCLKNMPRGYEISPEVRNMDKFQAGPPILLHYREKHMFQLRAHMYQARSLIGSDASGLSDPFARVVIGEYSQITQVIEETLSPTWDELIIFPEILVYGHREDIKAEPPAIVIEIFDMDKVGKSEYIGRAIAKPHVKLLEEPYAKPQFPPSLEWYQLNRGSDCAGELLATFELLETKGPGEKEDLPDLPQPKECILPSEHGPILPVPLDIRPSLAKYRIEVLFWGLRDLKRIHLMSVDSPRVDIECAGHILASSVIQSYKKNPNFTTTVKFYDVELPELALYCPPLTIRVVDCRSFGRFTLVGTHIINSLHKYLYVPMTKREREAQERKKSLLQLGFNDQTTDPIALDSETAMDNKVIESSAETLICVDSSIGRSLKQEKTDSNLKRQAGIEDDSDEENKDWWTKYFSSVEAFIEEGKEARGLDSQKNEGLQNGNLINNIDDLKTKEIKWNEEQVQKTETKKTTFKGAATAVRFAKRLSPKKIPKKVEEVPALLKMYPNELEAQPEFNGFKEWLHSFELYRGKKTNDDIEDDSRIVGIFKGSVKFYKIPLPPDIEDHTITGGDPQSGLFHGLPSNEPIHVLVRVYIVKANDLHPMDLNGKADPYIVLTLGNKRVSDKDNYISKQLNPVFGKCFEFEATIPHDSLLTVQIYDWDLVGSDDLIGETKIDLENRFYSRHRATCALPMKYEPAGYNQWRDSLKPSQILAKLCKDHKLDGPHIANGRVRIGRKCFVIQATDEGNDVNNLSEEAVSLAVLHKWQDVPKIGCKLVPEHVETRPLYNPAKPGIEQGKLEMWVDLFPMDMPLPDVAVEIAPRKPKSYELRVIIWNTDDVVLEDDAFFTGEKMSDIYVKGWLKGPDDVQTTDIHYRSLTGEGNFNWRFIYPFDYLVAEEKIVTSRKATLFSWDESESKIPARFELQVWDADHFSADDFLGAITLDLNRFPRGAKSSKLCTLGMLKADSSVPMISIFKQRRVKGWWPFFVKKDNDEMELTGKVEAELCLLSKEEAEKNPAGLGRNEPDPLEKPNRPDSSFMWFLNPFKSIRYIIWHNYKWAILKLLLLIMLILILGLFYLATLSKGYWELNLLILFSFFFCHISHFASCVKLLFDLFVIVQSLT